MYASVNRRSLRAFVACVVVGTLALEGLGSLPLANAQSCGSIGEAAGTPSFALALGGNGSYNWIVVNGGECPFTVQTSVRTNLSVAGTTPPMVTTEPTNFTLDAYGSQVVQLNVSVPDDLNDSGQSWTVYASAVEVGNCSGGGTCVEAGVLKIGYVSVPVPAFSETGLPVGYSWTVTFNGVTRNLTADGGTDTLAFAYEYGGSYSYSILPVPGFTETSIPYNGTETIVGADFSETITYVPFTYALTFSESGLPLAAAWSLVLAGVMVNSTSSTVVLTEPNGTYSYAILPPTGYAVSPMSGQVAVRGEPETILLFGVRVYAVTFTELGLPSGTWSVTIDGTLYIQPVGTPIVADLPNGTFGYDISNETGYQQASLPDTGTGTVTGESLDEPELVFVPVLCAVTFTEAGLPNGSPWAVVFDGRLATGTSQSLSFSVVAGTYTYSATAVGPGWVANPNTGVATATVLSAVTVAIAFSPSSNSSYPVHLTVNGVPSGAFWQAWVNSTDGGVNYRVSGSTANLVVVVQVGQYQVEPGPIAGYTSATDAPYATQLEVANAPVSIGVTYTMIAYPVTFSEKGLPPGTLWGISFGGAIHWSTLSTFTFMVAPGTYGWLLAYVSGYIPVSESAPSPTVLSGSAAVTIGFAP